MTIGEKIKQRRKELGLSIEDIAEKLDKNRATVYRYESNDIENLPLPILEPLSKILRCTPAYLMGWDDMDTNVESPKITPISQADGIQHLKAHAPDNDEIADLISKYTMLDETSKAAVNNYIDFELTQTQKRKGNI